MDAEAEADAGTPRDSKNKFVGTEANQRDVNRREVKMELLEQTERGEPIDTRSIATSESENRHIEPSTVSPVAPVQPIRQSTYEAAFQAILQKLDEEKRQNERSAQTIHELTVKNERLEEQNKQLNTDVNRLRCDQEILEGFIMECMDSFTRLADESYVGRDEPVRMEPEQRPMEDRQIEEPEDEQVAPSNLTQLQVLEEPASEKKVRMEQEQRPLVDRQTEELEKPEDEQAAPSDSTQLQVLAEPVSERKPVMRVSRNEPYRQLAIYEIRLELIRRNVSSEYISEAAKCPVGHVRNWIEHRKKLSQTSREKVFRWYRASRRTTMRFEGVHPVAHKYLVREFHRLGIATRDPTDDERVEMSRAATQLVRKEMTDEFYEDWAAVTEDAVHETMLSTRAQLNQAE